MEPLNYNLDVLSPFQMAIGGYGAAMDQAQQRQNMGLAVEENRRADEGMTLARDQFGLQQQQFGLAQDEFGLRQQAMAAAQAEQAAAVEAQRQGQAAMHRLIGLGGAATTEDYLIALADNPDYREQIGTVFEALQPERRDGELEFAMQAFSALEGNPALAAELFAERRRAAEAAGNAETAATMQSFEMLMQQPNGPEIVRSTIGLGLAATMGGADFKAAMEAMGVEEAPDLFDRERQIRTEYTQQTADFRTVMAAGDRIAATEDNGAGDLALVYSYMKILDPGSVVRESEFNMAGTISGLPDQIAALRDRIISGERLPQATREALRAQATSLVEAAKLAEARTRANLMPTVLEYGLSPENVFAVEPITEETPPPETPPPSPATPATSGIPPTFMSDQQMLDAARRNGTTPEAIWGIMTPEQRARYGG